jgi:hypothetical protein
MCDTHNTSFTFKFRLINNLGLFFSLRSSDGGAYFCSSNLAAVVTLTLRLAVAFASSLARETLALSFEKGRVCDGKNNARTSVVP